MKVKNDQQDAGIELKTLYGVLISDQQLIFYQKKKSQMFCQHHLCSLIHEQYHSIFFFFFCNAPFHDKRRKRTPTGRDCDMSSLRL